MAIKKGLGYKIFVALDFFIIVFLTLSIYSYSKDDPGFSNIVFSRYNEEVSNLFGKIGAYFADIIITLTGFSSILLPVLFFIVFLGLLRSSVDKKLRIKRYVLDSLLAVLLVIFLSLFTGFLEGVDPVFENKPAGGIIGTLASTFLVSLLGKYGGAFTTLFFIVIILILILRNTEQVKLKIGIPLNEYFKKIFKKNNKKREKKPDMSYEEKTFETIKDTGLENNFEIEPKETTLNNYLEPKIKNLEDVKMNSAAVNYFIPVELLENPVSVNVPENEFELKAKGRLLEEKLLEFGVEGKIKEIQPGPVVTLYEFEPAAGVKISRIANLENDLARAMSAVSVRIIAPIPGKSVVGIELPNKKRATVYLRELITSESFGKEKSSLSIILGKDIAGKPYVTDLSKMPHLLIAGTTGSGKSVCINTIVCSILYKSSFDKVKFVMIDPKMVELSAYEDIPHLAAPVVTDPKQASTVLKNVVEEMEKRYSILAEYKVRNIDSYNELAAKDKSVESMPYLVVIVDEFADLMIVAGKEVEQSIIRIAQMARAVGIHLILATQRPSVNVITGIIKANMPARLSFRVSSKTDSRTILDQNGAETLLGRGDSLFIPPGSSDPVRIHGCFVSETEVSEVVSYLKTLGEPEYNMDLIKEEVSDAEDVGEEELDEKYYEALDLVLQKGMASISMIQRHLRIGYNRAARIVEIMERQGVIGPSDGTSKPRELLKK